MAVSFIVALKAEAEALHAGEGAPNAEAPQAGDPEAAPIAAGTPHAAAGAPNAGAGMRCTSAVVPDLAAGAPKPKLPKGDGGTAPSAAAGGGGAGGAGAGTAAAAGGVRCCAAPVASLTGRHSVSSARPREPSCAALSRPRCHRARWRPTAPEKARTSPRLREGGKRSEGYAGGKRSRLGRRGLKGCAGLLTRNHHNLLLVANVEPHPHHVLVLEHVPPLERRYRGGALLVRKRPLLPPLVLTRLARPDAADRIRVRRTHYRQPPLRQNRAVESAACELTVGRPRLPPAREQARRAPMQRTSPACACPIVKIQHTDLGLCAGVLFPLLVGKIEPQQEKAVRNWGDERHLVPGQIRRRSQNYNKRLGHSCGD
eukprot:scaffold1785_cov95-Isochrysis_galbana.AAC.6